MTQMDLSYLELPGKEQKILEASIKIFSEKGFSATTTNEIAKSAGVAEGTIFRYFKTKKDILRSILVHTINLVSEKMVLSGIEALVKQAEDKDMRWFLKELLYDRLKLLNSIFPMARVMITEAIYHEEVRQAAYESIFLPAEKLFEGFLTKMTEKGLIRKGLDPKAAFRCILGNMFMLIVSQTLSGNFSQENKLDLELDKTIDIILNGIES